MTPMLTVLLTLHLVLGGGYQKASERDFQRAHHKGIMEYRLPDGSRVDDLTPEYAVEYDFARKWAESVGQSLHYARITGRKAGIVLILTKDSDADKVNNIILLGLPITVWTVRNLRDPPLRVN